MTDGLEPDLGVYVKQPLSQDRLDRQWRRLASAMDPAAPSPTPSLLGRRRRWIMAFGAVGVAGVLALFLVTGRIRHLVPPLPTSASAPGGEPPFVVEGSRIENQSGTTRALSLADGSQVALAPAGAIVLARSRQDDLRLVLERGSADFDVTHVPGRRFVVVAADVDVVVVGTRFVVTVSDGQQGKVAAVSVQRGAVEVHRPRARAMRFLPGQSWSSAETATPVTSPSAEPPAESPPPPSPPAPARPIPAPARAAPLEDARSLLGVARQARLQGKHQEAVAALEKLCRRFPGDPSAPLAAFQLGRIQLDTLHETARAATSFHTAATLAREPTLRESAAAREVEALDQGGDASACRAARDAYRAAYPTGPHLGRVTAYCRGR